MAIAKNNPAATTTGSASEVIGKDISIFSLDYIVANASTGPSGAQQAVLNAIQETRVILAAGATTNSNTEQTFIIEGELDSGLQARIQALGTIDGVDLSGTWDSSSNLKKSWAQRDESSKALCLVRLEMSIPYLRQAASWLMFLTPNLLLANSIAQVTSAQISETVDG